MSFYKSAPILLVGALFLFCGGVWSVVYAEARATSNNLTLAVLDVGQGDALYIESPTGVQVLVDAGPDNSVLRELGRVMPALDRSLDAVLATHPDADHIGGLSEVVERYEVGAYIYPGVSKDTATAKSLEKLVDQKQIPRVLARRGMVLDLGAGATLEILYPEGDVSYLPSEKANEGGVVALLRYGEFEALLTADVGAGVERRLLQLGAEVLDSDVLKVGHHGSRFSSAQRFVEAVSPEVALISVSASNRYGHPTQQVLSILIEAGAEILRTDENGTLRCVSDGASFSCD